MSRLGERTSPASARAKAALGVAVAFGIAAVAAACGRKALPRPPQWVIPESPAPLEVTTVDDGIKLSWRRPTKYVDGRSLDDLGRFDVERACLGFPFEKVAELDVDDRARFRRNRAFAWIDRSPQPAEPCHYRVTAWTLDGYGSAPAESWLGAPSPTPAPSPTASPDGTAPAPSAAPSPDPTSALPAPLASPTPEIPPAPAHAH